MAQSPDHPFCSFCHHRDPRDSAKYTHFVKNPDGSCACPYLQLTQCPRCFMHGHTAKHCDIHTRVMKLEKDAEINLGTDAFYALPEPRRVDILEARLRLANFHVTHQTAHYKWDRISHQVNTGQLSEETFKMTCCSYCYNGNKHDHLFMTHKVYSCPKLACTRCKYCNKLGHTQAKCEQIKIDKLMKEAHEDGEYDEWWIDFNEEPGTPDVDGMEEDGLGKDDDDFGLGGLNI